MSLVREVITFKGAGGDCVLVRPHALASHHFGTGSIRMLNVICVFLSTVYSYDKCCYVLVFCSFFFGHGLSPLTLQLTLSERCLNMKSQINAFLPGLKATYFIVSCSEKKLNDVTDSGYPYLVTIMNEKECYAQKAKKKYWWNAIKSIFRYLGIRLKILQQIVINDV